MATPALNLPVIDFSSTDRLATAELIRQACLDHGFFYLVNHGVEEEEFRHVFEQSKRFFGLSSEEKMKLARNRENRGYSPLYAENLNADSARLRGDAKESFYIGPMDKSLWSNQWPAEDTLPEWRSTMELYYEKVLILGKALLSLIALALNLNADFFENVGAFPPNGFVRLLHYPGDVEAEDCGASAHSDYGMVTLLASEGVPGLQMCREKDKCPRNWENVPHINGAFIVNIGDMLERWTNCLFRSTLHRVMTSGQERYSIAFFFDPNPDCIVECLKSCCSEMSPARFPPIRSGDYLAERFRLTYGDK